MLDGFNKRMAAQRIRVVFSPLALKRLAHDGFDPVYGARPMRRVLQRHVETPIARELLLDHVRKGDLVEIADVSEAPDSADLNYNIFSGLAKGPDHNIREGDLTFTVRTGGFSD
jgi:ATP-dependent Clp protease ATP-binding subunit ClpA